MTDKTKNKVLPILEHMAEFDPEGAIHETRRVWDVFADAAGTTPEELRRALGRVTWDGYFGPVSDREYLAAEGIDECSDEEFNKIIKEHMTLSYARGLLRAALEAEPTVTYEHPDVGYLCCGTDEGSSDGACLHQEHQYLQDPGPLFHCEPITVEARAIKECVFHPLIEIYGTLQI